MSYNTVSQFRTYSITSGSFDAVPSAVIQENLNVAANEIDSALINHHTLPFASGSVPESVLEAERVIAGYRLWMTMGFDPGVIQDFLRQRYVEIVGVPDKPDSGLLGAWAFGRRLLINNSDQDPSVTTVSYKVTGTSPRGWYDSINPPPSPIDISKRNFIR